MYRTRFLQKNKKRIIYIRGLIRPEEFQMPENTLDGFYHLLDQTQTEEEHVDCSCAGLVQLSTQAELQPLNNVL